MIVAMAGLPGVGKSTLARLIADSLRRGLVPGCADAVVLDKDQVRACLFPPSRMDYSRAQNDFCMDVLYRTAGWLVHRDRSLTVIIDGCTYSRSDQVTTLRGFGWELGENVRIIECVCDEEVALSRIEHDRATKCHPAGDRGATLYHTLRNAAEPIGRPKLVVDTGQSTELCLADCLHYLAGG